MHLLDTGNIRRGLAIAVIAVMGAGGGLVGAAPAMAAPPPASPSPAEPGDPAEKPTAPPTEDPDVVDEDQDLRQKEAVPGAEEASAPPQAKLLAAPEAAVHPVTIVATTTAETADADQETTEQAIRDEFEGMAQYWFDQSGGRIDFELEELVWWPGQGVCGDGNPTITNDAKAEAGFTAGKRKHFMVNVAAGCTFTGNASQPSSIDAGGNVYIEGFWDGLWSHEFGHNLSFGHANLLDCPNGDVDGEVTGPGADCKRQSYADPFDTMGASSQNAYGGLSTPSMIRTGLLAPGDYTAISGNEDADEDVTITSRSLLRGMRSVQVTDPLTDIVYTVEMATSDGYDVGDVGANGSKQKFAGSDFTYLQNYGVRVLRVDGQGTTQLAMPADDSGVRSTAWTAGSTFATESGGVEITVASTTATTATLSVRTDQDIDPSEDAPTATVETETLEAGTEQTVYGTGFAPGEAIKGVVHPGNHQVGTTTADGSGNASLTFTVPASLPNGQHTIALTGQSVGDVARAGFTVEEVPISKWPEHDLVPNVSYRIENGASGLAAAAPSGAAGNTQLVQRSGTDNGTSWNIRTLGEGYQLKNDFSSRCMDVRGNSTSPGAAITQYTCETSSNEQWKILDRPQGGTVLVNVLSGLCLAPSKDATTDGAGLVQQTCSSTSAAQDWDLTSQVPPVDSWKEIDAPVTSVPYAFTNAMSGLDAGISKGGGNERIIQREAGDIGTQFTLVPNDDGTYGLKNLQDKLCATLIGTGAGAYGFTYTCDTTSAVKKWKLLENPAGGVSIYNVRDGLCLTPRDGSSETGAGLVVSDCTIQPASRWDMNAVYPTVDQWKPAAVTADVPYAMKNVASDTSASVPEGTAVNTSGPLVIRPSDGALSNFTVEKNADDTYRIRNVHSKRCVDVAGASSAENARVATWSCSSAANQKWRVLDNPAGGTSFQSVSSGKCLGTNKNAIADGTTLAQTTCGIAPAQRWDFAVALPPVDDWAPVDLPAGSQTIGQVSSGLGIGTRNPDLSTNFVALQDDALPTAQWTLETTTDGSAHIINVNRKTCLDVRGNSTKVGAQVHTYTCGLPADEPAQRWEMLENPQGQVSFRNLNSGLCLSTKDSGDAVGTITTLATCGYGSDQRWSVDAA